MPRRGLALAAILLLWCASASLAQGPAAGDQFQVSTYTTNRQSSASVAPTADDGFVVVWSSYGSGGSDTHQYSIQGRRYDTDGTARGDQFQVNTHTPFSQTNPVVAPRDDGFMVAWTSHRSSGSDDSYTSIQGRHFAADGAAMGNDFQINTSTLGVQNLPSLAALTDGGVVAVWHSRNDPGAPGLKVMGQRYDAGGATRGDELQISLTPGEEQAIPAVAGLSDGGFVVVWTHFDGVETRVSARRYGSDGRPLTGEFQIWDVYGFFPRVTGLTDGGFLVIWEHLGSSIDGRRYRADGSPAGDIFRLTSGLTQNFALPDIAPRSEGGFVLVWPGKLPGTTNNRSGIRAQLFDATNSPVGGELWVETYAVERQGFPSVATQGNGEIVVVWEGRGSPGSETLDTSIQGRRFLPPRFALTGLGGKCLDVEGAEPSDGTPVSLYRCHGGDNQRWQMELTAKPQRVIGLEGKCLIPDSVDPDDVRTVIGECDGSEALWQLATPGHVEPSTLIHVDTGLCLDVEGASSDDGTPVGLFACHGRSNQLWRPAAEVCTQDSLGLCLEDRRFRAEVTWRSFDGSTGSAQAVPVGSSDSGLLWFFEAENWEMLIKVLDGCAINDRFWLLSAATTTVEYTLTVTDTAVGTTTEYFNPLGNAAAAIIDTFATCSAGDRRSAGVSSVGFEPTPVRQVRQATVDEASKGLCYPSQTKMCLSDARFSVAVEWRDPAGNAGSGQVVDLGPDRDDDTSGLFWFFGSSNWEMLVKVLDACDVNGQFLFLGAATTDVEYTVTVTDTDTGTAWQSTNPQGSPSEALVRWFDCQ